MVELLECYTDRKTLYPLGADDSVKEQSTPWLEVNTQSGYEEGFAQGLLEGRAQGSLEAKQHNQSLQKQLASILYSIPAHIQTFLGEQKPQIIELFEAVFSSFFIHNAVSKQNIEYAIQSVIDRSPQQQNIQVYLSVEDYTLLQNHNIQLDLQENIRIAACEKVKLGGCLITSEQGTLDGRLENRMDKLKDVLLQYKKQVAHERL